MNTLFALYFFVEKIILEPLLPFKGITFFSGISAVIAGGAAGILINYFSDVLPVSRRITRPVCGVCGQPYSIKDYLVQFKCSNCGNTHSKRSVLVIAVSIGCCILLLFFPFSTLGFWATLPILVFLGMIVVIDIEHRIVVFQTNIIGFVLFFTYGILMNNLSETLLGALGGFAITLTFYLLGKAFTKLAGKIRNREINEVALGFGDVCLGTILGLLAGWPVIVGAIIIAIFSFSAYSIVLLAILIISKRYRSFSNAQPFTLFLILGMIAIFYL